MSETTGYTKEQRDKIDAARRYLETGGLGEVIGLADITYRYGGEKVQMDTDMALALCFMAVEAPVEDPSPTLPT
jgi:hypothetical protein